ncbi:MAG: enoyl-CoA hydratase/isomerase family protein [Acidobacteriota bacterium]
MTKTFTSSLLENGVAVIGAGNMGSGIAQKLAQVGIPVFLCDRNLELAQAGKAKIVTLLEEAVSRKIFLPNEVDDILARVRPVDDFSQLKDAALVIEAVFEEKEVKTSLFRQLDSICRADTLFATNTSSLSVSELGAESGRADRFGGLHFFYHPAKNRLLEIITGKTTSAATERRLWDFARLAEKVAIRSSDRAGFAVNRFFVPWLNEAVRVLEEGKADIPTIEAAAKEAFGCGMGPFELMNITGIPIAYHAATSLGEALGSFYLPAERLAEQAQGGKDWELSGEASPEGVQEIQERLLGCAFTIATALAEEKVATREDIDRGATVGLRWSEGPFQKMNRLGTPAAYKLIAAFRQRYRQLEAPASLRTLAETNSPWPLSFVDLQVGGGVARITINRPEAMNALNPALMEQLGERVEDAIENPEVALLLFEGAGKAFVAGADVRFFIHALDDGDLSRIYAFTEQGQRVFERIATSNKPTIALVDGLALGGGAELALACKTIIVGARGTFAFPETGIGIYPALGGTQRLSRRIGKELAQYLILTGRAVDSAEAFAIGLADGTLAGTRLALLDEEGRTAKVVALAREKRPTAPPPPAWAKAAQLVFSDQNRGCLLSGELPALAGADLRKCGQRALKDLSGKAPVAVRIASQLIEEGFTLPLDEALKLEVGRLAEVFQTSDAYRGLCSVGRKRPAFEGK